AAREAAQQGRANGAVLEARDREEEAECDGEEEDQADERAACEEAEAGLYADPGAQHGGNHRKREQPVGVAQHPVAGRGREDAARSAEASRAQLVLLVCHAFSLHRSNVAPHHASRQSTRTERLSPGYVKLTSCPDS